MNSEKKPGQGRRLSVIAATIVATTTSMGCTEAHVTPAVDASEEVADASAPADAGSRIDASSPMDAAIAMVDASAADAAFAADDADIPDADHPTYVRG